MHYTLVRDSSTSDSHMVFLSNLTSGLPRLTPSRPLTPSMHYTLACFLFPCQIWWPQGILRYLTSGWPLHDLWPQQWVTLWSGVLPTKLGGNTAFLMHLTSGWPRLTSAWPLTPTMHYTLVRVLHIKFGDHRALLSKLINWSLLDPSWPLHGLRPQQCITLWSGVFPTKFGGHRAL